MNNLDPGAAGSNIVNQRREVHGPEEDISLDVSFLLENTNLVPRTLARIDGLTVDTSDAVRPCFSWIARGSNRDVFSVKISVRGYAEPASFIMKVSLDASAKQRFHQVLAALFEPPEVLDDIGGIWELPDGRVVLTQRHYPSAGLNDRIRACVHEGLNPREIGECVQEETSALISRSIRFWRDMGRRFISDPFKSQFTIDLGEEMSTDMGYDVNLIDTAQVSLNMPHNAIAVERWAMAYM